MFRTVISDERDDRDDLLVGAPEVVFRLQPNMLLSAGSSAIGSVAQTDATVRIPAKR